MFGTSGIRGLYGPEVNEALAYRVAHAFADTPIVIGRDTRRSGPALLQAAAAGAIERGQDVIDLGIAPTPTVALATQLHRSRGIMLTASHNPEEYQGLKLLEDGKEISKAQEHAMAQKITSTSARPLPDRLPVRHDPAVLGSHKSLIHSLIDSSKITSKKPKIVVDCNGAAAVITPSLLTDLGCHVVSLNAQLSGFARLPEPTSTNLQTLSQMVRATGAAAGIAHDGDADRAVILDETGELLGLDVQLALAIEQELEHSSNKHILTTVEASLLVRERIEQLGGRYQIGPVGSTHLSHELERTGAAFGGEPCGEYVYAKATHCPDGVLAAAKFVQLLSEKGPLSKLKARFKPYPLLREKYACSKDKAATMEKIKSSVSVEGQRNEQDGLRIDEEDGWFLIRASGTEPVIRLTAEYKDKSKLEARTTQLRSLIQPLLR